MAEAEVTNGGVTEGEVIEGEAVPGEPAQGQVVELRGPQDTASLLPAPLPSNLPGRQAAPSRRARQSDVDRWGRSEATRALVRRAFDPVYRRWFRVEWEGLEHVPRHGGALLVANHAGAIPPDAPVIMHGIERELGRPVYGLGAHLFRRLPVVGVGWNRAGGVLAHPDNAHRLLTEDEALVLVFPEGEKGPSKPVSQRYRLRRFGRGGFVEIAMRAGVPIVPIAVVGAEEAMPVLVDLHRLGRRVGLSYLPVTANLLAFGPLGAGLWFPAKIRLRVLPPVHLDAAPGLDRYPRSKVLAASESVRQQIQEALYDLLRERRSIWFG